MMIGPAPMIRTLLMSLRLGMALLFDRFDETIEEVVDVVRTGARLGVSLETERRAIRQCETLQAAVEERHVSDACVRGKRRGIDGEAVILARDHDAARVQILHRMVRAMMAELHLHGLRAHRESQQLVT